MTMTAEEREYVADRKGSRTAQPIKRIADIQKIKTRLQRNLKHQALLVVGINTAFRGVDLVRLRVKDVLYLKPGDSFTITERKTLKKRTVTLNRPCTQVIRELVFSSRLQPDDYLFQGQRRGERSLHDPIPHLSRHTLSALVRAWCRDINLPGSWGSHTLRKTYAYHQYRNGADLGTLMKALNHSSISQTLQYICVQDDEVAKLAELEL